MSETKIKVPEGMLKAIPWDARKVQHGTTVVGDNHVIPILEAAILWQRDNAPVPTSRQIQAMSDSLTAQGDDYHGTEAYCAEWVRCMYGVPGSTPNPVVAKVRDTLAGSTLTAGDAVELMDAVRRCTTPEPEVPEGVKDLLQVLPNDGSLADPWKRLPADVTNERIVEAYRRGQQDRGDQN